MSAIAEAQIDRLNQEIQRLRTGIRLAAEALQDTDDTVWFNQSTTLHDYLHCLALPIPAERIPSPAERGERPLLPEVAHAV